jgi:hypothetical protein
MTLAELRTAIRQRGDYVNSSFFTDAELNSYINQSYFELYDLMVQKYGDDYFVASPYSITTDGTNDKFNLPSDFYKLTGVDLLLGNSLDSAVSIKQFNMTDRNRFSVPNFQSFYGVTNMRYRLHGGKIWFTPLPQANQTIRLWYVPKMTTLDSDSATVDGVSGWTEYIIVDCLIKCKTKEETDPTPEMAMKQMLINRLESAAENRDAAMPQTVADNNYSDYWWPTGNGSGVGGVY